LQRQHHYNDSSPPLSPLISIRQSKPVAYVCTYLNSPTTIETIPKKITDILPVPWFRRGRYRTARPSIPRTSQTKSTTGTRHIVYDHLKKGTYNFTVRSTDAAGNTGEDQFTRTVNPAEAAKAKPR
jgi:hypothetical protein